MTRRHGEGAGKRYFRSERLFCSNGLWYFATREGVDQGPFESRAAARRAIARFVVETAGRDVAAGTQAATGCLDRLHELALEPLDPEG